MELKIGKSCGSCIHTNRPKKPREHAAHYEVAKTERWCFKYQCHVTRETVCENGYEGVTRAAKTAFTRTHTYNERISAVHEVIEIMKNYGKPVITHDYIYYLKNDWIHYVYGNDISVIETSHFTYMLSTKESGTERRLNDIINIIKS